MFKKTLGIIILLGVSLWGYTLEKLHQECAKIDGLLKKDFGDVVSYDAYEVSFFQHDVWIHDLEITTPYLKGIFKGSTRVKYNVFLNTTQIVLPPVHVGEKDGWPFTITLDHGSRWGFLEPTLIDALKKGVVKGIRLSSPKDPRFSGVFTFDADWDKRLLTTLVGTLKFEDFCLRFDYKKPLISGTLQNVKKAMFFLDECIPTFRDYLRIIPENLQQIDFEGDLSNPLSLKMNKKPIWAWMLPETSAIF